MDLNDLLTPKGDAVNFYGKDKASGKDKFAVGEAIQGTISAPIKVIPDTDWKTKEQKVSKYGKPQWKLAIPVVTAEGDKILYAERAVYWAVIQALKAAGVSSFAETPGLAIGIKRDPDTSTDGGFDRKEFSAVVKKTD